MSRPKVGPDADGTGGILDPVAYQAETSGITEPELQAALASPRFRAAVTAFRTGLVPLGYVAFYCWPEVETMAAASTPERLTNLIRYATRRSRLPSEDPRRIPVDEARVRMEHPDLFVRAQPGRQKSGHDGFMRDMGNFLKDEPLRDAYINEVERAQRGNYAKYWMRKSWSRVQELLSDRVFMAAFDAYRSGIVSYAGFLDNLSAVGHQVLQPLDSDIEAAVVYELAEAANRGEITIPPDLRDEFPRFYEFYMPDASGYRDEEQGAT